MNAAMVADALDLETTTQAELDAADFPLEVGCAFCHGLFDQSHLDKLPLLARQKPSYITAQLNTILTGPWTSEGDRMSAIVTELLPNKIPVAVAWCADRDPLQPSDTADPEFTNAKGIHCCLNGSADDDIPHLTTQHSGYMVKHMRDVRGGRCSHSEAVNNYRNRLTDMAPDIGLIPAHTSSLERTP